MSSASCQSPIGTHCSSNCTRPRDPAGLIGAYGTTCFCPLSAIAANHCATCRRRSHARIAGLSALFPRHTDSPSTNTE